jgi:hypothetical protein
MAVVVTHGKTNNIADWTQADLDAQIALGNFPPGTILADIVLPSDWNDDHTVTGLATVAETGDYGDLINAPALAAVATSGDYSDLSGVPTKVSVFSNDAGYTTNTGTVTSVGASVPTGLTITGSPVTGTGTLAITLTAGYEIPTTAALAAKSDKTRTLNTQTGTTYTLVLTDADKIVEANNAAAVTVTVPPNSSVAFPTGTQIDLVQYGAGQVTVAQGAGVTIRSFASSLKSAGRYAGLTLYKRGTDEWVLTGNLA